MSGKILRLILALEDRERLVELSPGERILVGRSIDAGFFLNDLSVSRKHCTLRATDAGAVVVADEGSKSGTILDGKRLAGEAALEDGARLLLGKLEFRVRLLESRVPCKRCGAPVAESAPGASAALCAACERRESLACA